MPEDVIQPTTASPSNLTELFVFEQPARRLELLVRILYWIIIGLVLMVYGIIATACLIIQWFVILILGHRNRGLSDFIQGYLEYRIHVTPYSAFMTDRRPDLNPHKVRIFEEYPVGEKK
ncbi:MAG TPA: DUF4389 domain-containing protein [Methanomicrobiales archaeon]|nr:DUF4389 domain-containing protein [Methanomicrobiales archaeon]